MKIKKILIKNFRLFQDFEISKINIPDNIKEGSGLTVFVGENGCGKTSILDAFASPLLSYKAESFSISDFNNASQETNISVFSEDDFEVKKTMPNGSFKAKGFLFKAVIRARENKAFLSSIVVSDQKFIKSDGQEKPEDNSPDLRINVNNPFSGQRFNENEVLFLDKNRTYQIRSGTYNTTRFDRLMEDFDYQYIKKNNTIVEDINNKINFVKENIKNTFLNEALEHFKELSDRKIQHDFIKNHQPFKESFFAETTGNNLQIPLDKLGSGYEMIFSILYSFYLSRQSNKQLIVFIDEPELHLHPMLQSKFVKILLEFSKTAQIILTTHSPLFVKQLLSNNNVLVNIIKNQERIEILPLEKRLLPFLSSAEINYLAFNLPNEEYHNELYGHIQEETQNETLNNMDAYLFNKSIPKNKEWIKLKNGITEPAITLTLPTYIRNAIHHPENTFNAPYTLNELNASIEQLRKLFPILE